MPIITIPKVIREKLGEEGSEAIAKLFNEIEEGIKKDSIAIVEEKFERRLSEELGKLRVEIAGIRTGLQREIVEMKTGFQKGISGTRGNLLEKIAGTRTGLQREIAETKTDLQEKITETKTDLQEKIAETKTFLFRWMFIFWVGQIGVLIGILFSFLK